MKSLSCCCIFSNLIFFSFFRSACGNLFLCSGKRSLCCRSDWSVHQDAVLLWDGTMLGFRADPWDVPRQRLWWVYVQLICIHIAPTQQGHLEVLRVVRKRFYNNGAKTPQSNDPLQTSTCQGWEGKPPFKQEALFCSRLGGLFWLSIDSSSGRCYIYQSFIVSLAIISVSLQC